MDDSTFEGWLMHKTGTSNFRDALLQALRVRAAQGGSMSDDLTQRCREALVAACTNYVRPYGEFPGHWVRVDDAAAAMARAVGAAVAAVAHASRDRVVLYTSDALLEIGLDAALRTAEGTE